METVHRIAGGNVITYMTSGVVPSTNELIGITRRKGPVLTQTEKPQVKTASIIKKTPRLTIACGSQSAHCSAKEGFSYTVQSRDKENSKERSKYENSRKPRGKKQKGGMTIREYLN